MMKQSGMPFYFLEGFLLMSGALVYTVGAHHVATFPMLITLQTRIPESLKPGCFDIFGCSHQIFHMLVVLATITHFMGILSAFDYNFHHRVCIDL